MGKETGQPNQQSSDIFPLPNSTKWDAIHQVFFQGENYYRVTDVIDALEIANDASNYWSLMKGRLKTEGFQQARQELVPFEIETPKGKRLRKHDYATRRTLLRIAQSIPSPRLPEQPRLPGVGVRARFCRECDRDRTRPHPQLLPEDASFRTPPPV